MMYTCEGDDVSLVTTLIEHDKLISKKLLELESENNEKQEEILKIEEKIMIAKERLDSIDKEFHEISVDAKRSSTDSENYEEISYLLEIYERLKLDEKKFKKSCNIEMERMQSLANDTNDSVLSQSDLEAQLGKAVSRLEARRVEFGVINRKLELLKRQIDQIPNRTELREYRLRFSELYNQVSSTHRQTKQYFSLYNSLEDSKRYLEKELSLLNSIVDSYNQVSVSASGKENLLKQLSILHEGMKDSCSKVEKINQGEILLVENLVQKLHKLLDQNVSYEKCLKDLEKECQINDKLLSRLKKKVSLLSQTNQ